VAQWNELEKKKNRKGRTLLKGFLKKALSRALIGRKKNRVDPDLQEKLHLLGKSYSMLFILPTNRLGQRKRKNCARKKEEGSPWKKIPVSRDHMIAPSRSEFRGRREGLDLSDREISTEPRLHEHRSIVNCLAIHSVNHERIR